MLTNLKNIRNAIAFSDEKISYLRDSLRRKCKVKEVAVVIVGSLARREANQHSDVDYFIIDCGGASGAARRRTLDRLDGALKGLVGDLGLRAPAVGGAFGGVVAVSDMAKVIGGEEDSNLPLTRRMLFLLESDWIFGEEKYRVILDDILIRYISDKITKHQISRFLLNDIIRYYRTICVDFEYKTSSIGKSWGDRNIKLMFSRRLLYVSGLLAVASTAQSTASMKRLKVRDLLMKTPIDRLASVCGADALPTLSAYDEFLGWLADGTTRDLLGATCSDRNLHSDEFRSMKNAGHHFSWNLEMLLQRRYPLSHPIHQALML